MEDIRYPIGVQTFDKNREGDYLYIDKTDLVYLLAKDNYVFLSRPRRFGKSLLLSTIEAYFQGRKDLFKGLAIEKLEKEWKQYPVFRFDMTGRTYDTSEDVRRGIGFALERWEEKYGLEHRDLDIGDRFYRLLIHACEVSGQKAVILIDEYDKPIIDVLENREKQEEIRRCLQGFYSVLKKADEYIRFAMLTGVGKFAHLSIFSGLNNLHDITMSKKYSTICGITEREMHEYFGVSSKIFAEENGISIEETWAQFKEKYDGYHFCRDCEDIYNPFSVLSAFASNTLSDYWYRTATPSFLPKLLRRNRIPLGRLEAPLRSESDLADITDNTKDIVPLLFQSGYMTLRGWDDRRKKYILGFPNREVYSGFWDALVREYFPITLASDGFDLFTFLDELNAGETDSFMERLQALIASATSETEPDKEIHFQNIMAIVCRMLGLEVSTEIHSAMGRCDMTVKCPDYIYIFEFKIDSDPEKALEQIHEKGYARPYMADKRTKILVGANFSTERRTLSGWISEQIQ